MVQAHHQPHVDEENRDENGIAKRLEGFGDVVAGLGVSNGNPGKKGPHCPA